MFSREMLQVMVDRPDIFWVYNRIELPYGISGIYILVENEIVQYIGRSYDIRRRLTKCHRAYSRLTNCLIGVIRYDDLSILPEIETILIDILNPPENTTAVTQSVKKMILRKKERLLNQRTKKVM